MRGVAHLLASVVRAADGVVRWGGEEFLVILPGVDKATAHHIVERARKTIEESTIIKLSAEDQQRFAEALIAPAPLPPAMERAISRHRRLIRRET